MHPVAMGAHEARGRRDYMEDRHTVIADFKFESSPSRRRSRQEVQKRLPASSQICGTGACFAAVFDGHSGETGIVVNCVRPDTLEVGVFLISFHFISFIYIDVYILFLHFKMLSVCLLACLFVCVCFCQ